MTVESREMPSRTITLAELRRQNGERGARKWIVFKRVVYDVTDCPKWKLDLHENLHFSGQDLSEELVEAPHAEEVFTRPCVRVVGMIQRNDT